MNAIALIKKDHERVSGLFKRYNDGGVLTGLVRRMTGNGASEREKRSIRDTICAELDVHARMEEELFYPAVRATGDPDLARQLDEALKEHAGVKDEVAYLREHPDAEDADDRVAKLQGDVDHHVREEENEMLPRVEELIPEAELVALGRRMQARKRALGAAAPKKAGKARRSTARKRTTSPTVKRRAQKPVAKPKRARPKSKRRAS